MRFLIASILVLLTSFGQESKLEKTTRIEDEENIREVVFRWLIEKRPHTQVVFLSVERKDPSKILMNRFKGNRQPVLPKSKSDLFVPAGEGILKDRKTGKAATVITVGGVTWQSGSEAQVHAGYGCGARCGAGFNFWLKKVEGSWKVEKAEQTDISLKDLNRRAPSAPGFPPFEKAR